MNTFNEYMAAFNASQHQSLKITVMGLGYVGLPLAQAFEKAGFDVVGYDPDQVKVEKIDRDRALSFSTWEPALCGNGFFWKNSDVYIVCVPTPLKDGKPDLSHIEAAAELIPPDALVVVESTVGIRDTEKYFAHAKWLAFSPERVDPGSGRDMTVVPKLVGARDEESRILALLLYGTVFEKLYLTPDIKTAEMAKLMENTYRAVNIALANEFKAACESVGVDVWDALDAAATKPFGFQRFDPGPGVGGHCIPIDPVYLTTSVKVGLPLLERAMSCNAWTPLDLAVNVRSIYCMNTTRDPASILIVGLAYKKNTDDIRESPARVLLEIFKKRGYDVAWYDDHVKGPAPAETVRLMHWSKGDVQKFDAVVLVTDHDDLDYSILEDHPFVFDTRGRLPRSWKGVHRV